MRKGYVLMPGQFILAHTAETVRIPDNCAAMLLLRSSAARAGFEHSFSGWCDPGFVRTAHFGTAQQPAAPSAVDCSRSSDLSAGRLSAD